MQLKRLICGILAALLLLGLVGCTSEQPEETVADGTGEAAGNETQNKALVQPMAFLSDNDVKFKKQDNSFVNVYYASELDDSTGTVIYVDMESENQTIDGFGASFTDSATHMLGTLSEEARNDVMLKLFDDEKGIGLDLIRNPLGACDFSLEYYTYDEMPEGETDYELEHFDFSRAAGQIALTKQAMEINPDIKLFLAPWTAPRWMKTVYHWNTVPTVTKLRRDCYDVYADYLVKCIQGYEEQGVPVYAFSVQNEPLIVTDWPSMYWEWEQLADFIIDRMAPALEEAGLDTKILNLDHNWQRLEQGGDSLMAATMGTSAGMAFHWYAGEPEQMVEIAEKFPGIDMYVTEASYDRPADIGCMLHISGYVTRSLRSGAQGYLMWNMALSHLGGPALNGNTWNSALVSVNEEEGTVTYTGDYYVMGHYSKFIHQGAVALDSTDTGAETDYKLTNIVTRNPNGTMTAVITNEMREEAVVKLVLNDQVIEMTVAPRSIVTLTWDAN